MTQEPTQIRIEREEGVAIVTLTRPDRLNAYTAQMGAELFRAMHELDMDDGCRVIVVTGEGRGFCAGADLESGGDTFARENAWEQARTFEQKVRPWEMRTPVIGAINGPAVGIGATLPMTWDMRLASDRARIGFVFSRRGILPEHYSTWILPRLIGVSRALELLLTGRILDADEALGYGLVSRVVPHDDLMTVARELAHEMATHTAPLSVALTKRLVWRQLAQPDPVAAKELEDRLFDWIGKHPDAAEGVEAFLEKRPPRWSARPSTDLPDEG